MMDNYFLANVAGTALPAVGGYLIAFFISRRKRKKEREQEYEKIKNALISILRANIIKDYRYYVKKGFMTLEDKEVFEEECNSYFAFGGDGVIHDIYDLSKEILLGRDKQ